MTDPWPVCTHVNTRTNCLSKLLGWETRLISVSTLKLSYIHTTTKPFHHKPEWLSEWVANSTWILLCRQFISFQSCFSEQNTQSVPYLIFYFCRRNQQPCRNPANQEMCSFHVYTMTLFEMLSCNRQFTIRRLEILFVLIGKLPFWIIQSLVMFVIMFDYLSTRLSRLDTNCHCLHSKYLLTTCTLISDLHYISVIQN